MSVIVATQSEKKYSCTQDSDCTRHLNKPGSYGEILCLFFFSPHFYFTVFDKKQFGNYNYHYADVLN